MLAGNFNYQTKEREIDEYECPYDFIWEIDIPSANCTYSVAVRNANSANSAYIEWRRWTVV